MKRSILFRTLCVLVGFLFTSVITVFGSNKVDNFEEIRTLAKKGNVEAQVKLAELYYNGQGVEKDIDETIKWYKKAAKEKHIPALIALGNMYFNGSGVDKNEEEAFEWYEKAANLGSVECQLKLAKMYTEGIGVRKNCKKALEWYTKAADQGDAKAQYHLALMYEEGRGVAKDDGKALEWYTKSAEQGNASGQYHLGLMYEEGRGVAKDDGKALEWYTKSAEQSNASAQYHLGLMYEKGRGVAKDDGKALEWYTKSAEQGEQDAKMRLNLLKSKPRITSSIIEGCWTNVLENATQTSIDPRSKNADSKKGEGMLEAFGMQYMPNAYEYYQEVRAKAIEREQIFKENFPEGEKSDSTGGKLYTKVQKATAKAVGEYFRRRDELCHFYLMHKAGIMNSQDLMKLDEAKISMLLPAIDSEFVKLKSIVSKPTATERTFAEKYMPSTLVAYDRISKQMTETLELYKALILDFSILDALRGALALNVVASRFNLIVENNNALVATFNQNSLLHSVDDITIEDLAKQDEELSVKMQYLEKKLPIRDYGKEWLSQNWTDREKRYVLYKEALLVGLIFTMVEIPGKDYLISKYEVTQGLWEAVMGKNPSTFKGDLTRPVECVSWDDIQEFLKKLNELPEVKESGLKYRVPTADEWRYACRAGAADDYCKLADGTEITKATLGDVAWFENNSNDKTHPVGQKKPNAYGLYDMHGNVWEWTSTANGDAFVYYGGGWFTSGDNCRSCSRKRRYSIDRGNDIGFRLCASRRAVKAQELSILKNLMVEIPGKDYLMSKYEVTQGLWEAVMGKNPSEFTGALTRPVESVYWDGIQEFLKKLNELPEVKASGLVYRLPTADEWEYACRAGATGRYCKLADGTEITKATLGDVAWFENNSNDKTHPVGQKKPNAYGLYDMHGNVEEWTSTGNGDYYIVCCGSWRSSSGDCRSSYRDRYYSRSVTRSTGFRLCASRKKTQEEVK